MSKKSFVTQLFQGFVRSAVNQVGRDGGKVISNRVYHDSHSIPIRGVSRKSSQDYQNEENNFQPVFFTSSFILYPFMFIAELVLSPLGILNHGWSTFKYLHLMTKTEISSYRNMFLIKGILHLCLAIFFSWIAYTVIKEIVNL